jgi:hypothetical protein
MTYQTGDDALDAYLRLIEERILAPIEKTGVRESCTATLLLLFAAIDGVGKLLDDDDHAGSNKRIKTFLGYMGGDYEVQKNKLLGLRNSLAHSAINVESFLSRTETPIDQHLTRVGGVDFIYVNTVIMYKDFATAFARFCDDLKSDPALLNRAVSRLEWRDDIPQVDPNGPSHPIPIRFVYAK